MTSHILEIENISVEYRLNERTIKAVRNVNMNVNKGEIIGIVGESGSGKSTLALTILNLIELPGKITSGKILYLGDGDSKDVLKMKPFELRKYRWKEVAMIFQSALNSLNPVMKIEDQIADTLLEHGFKQDVIDKRIDNLLEMAGLSKSVRNLYPHELSGGMKQRVNIAIALSCDPKLLIADEATTALDVVVQKQILTRLLKLKKDLSLSVIFITHDISLLSNISNRINVMYAGKIVEQATTEEILNNPLHPYTQALLKSIPTLEKDKKIVGIKGSPPDLSKEIKGCPFRDRCDKAFEKCSIEDPTLNEFSKDHYVACHLYAR